MQQLAERKASGTPDFGILLWDAPASGHFVSTLHSARNFETFLTGPLASAGADLARFFSGTSHITLLPITTLEEMAIAEMAEMCAKLETEFDLKASAVLFEDELLVEHGMARGRARAGEAVAARVGELEYGEEAVRGAKSLLVRLAALGKQRLEARHGAFVDPKLARIGAAFGRDGASFKPDKLRAAGAKSAVAPERQLARRAIEFAVTAFHRVDCE